MIWVIIGAGNDYVPILICCVDSLIPGQQCNGIRGPLTVQSRGLDMKFAWIMIYFTILIWSGINPADYFTWFLEVAPALVGLAVVLHVVGVDYGGDVV